MSQLWILQNVSSPPRCVARTLPLAHFADEDVEFDHVEASRFNSCLCVAAALALASDNAKRNGMEGKISFVHSDVIDYLEQCSREKKVFDIVILDPPKFSPTRCVPHRVRTTKDAMFSFPSHLHTCMPLSLSL